MAKIPPELLELYKALNVVESDLRTEVAQHTELIGAKPFANWTQEKHDQYHRHYKIEAEQAIRWVHIRLMRIDPD